MNDYRSEFEVEGVKFPLVFNLNVMQEIQEEYGTIDEWGKLTDKANKEINVKALKFGIREMINEGIDIENIGKEEKRPFLSLKEVGRLITTLGVETSANKLNEAIIESTKNEEKN